MRMAQTLTLTVRAGITDAELAELRKLAIDRGCRVAELVADALRKTYNLEGAR